MSGFEASAGLGVQYLVMDFLGLHMQTTLVDYDRIKNTGVTYDFSGTSSNLNARLFSSFQIGASFFF